jgi:electron transport complex protein RnfD
MEKNNNLIVTVSPHLSSGESVNKVMWAVVIALLPAFIGSYFFFGIKAVYITLVSVVTAVILEAVSYKLMRRPVTVTDGSAVITGMLLAFNLPPTVPLWIPVLGSAVAILIAKVPFGGLGQNIFNPALVGRAFLLAAYPVQMTDWISSRFEKVVDISTYATPLGIIKEKLSESVPSYFNMFIGNHGGCIGETSALLLILGGIYLLVRKIITWHIPVTYILTVCLLTWVLGRDPLFNVLAGGLMLGAIYMATDMVTSPVTNKGMIIFAIGCGVMTVIIRLFGNYPEGVSYSILLMNACTPLIDRYAKPKKFGKLKY